MSAVEVLFARAGAISSSRPAYRTDGAAGMDLHAALANAVPIEPGHRVLIPTGWALALPDGFEGQVRPRSGRALKDGITVLNAPGTIDADFRGELRVLLINLGGTAAWILPDERIAQLVVCPIARASITEARELPPTARGSGGYGSTGS